MGKYREDAQELLRLVGGKDNIVAVTHCITRMRFALADPGKADVPAIEALASVKGSFTQAGQFQVIIGNDVADFYDDFVAVSGVSEASKADVKKAAVGNQNPLQKAMGAIAEVFAPLIPAIITGGLILGFRNVLGDMPYFGPDGTQTLASLSVFWTGVYNFLWLIGEAVFHLDIPVGICYSITKKMGGTPMLGIVLGLTLVSGQLMNAYAVPSATAKDWATHTWNFGFAQVHMIGYQAQVIPAILAAICFNYYERFFKKITPSIVQMIVVPFCSLLLGVMTAHFIVGPIGWTLGTAVGNVVMAGISGSFRVLFGAIFGGLYAPLVITGLHHMTNAIDLQLIADTGTTMLWPMIALSNIAQGSAVLAMIVLQRNDDKAQQVNIPSCLSCYLGVTEPAMFGVNLKYVFPFACAMIGSAVAGVICTATSTAANAIEPSAGEVVAPCDASVTVMMEETGHAVGLTLASGLELLIHIGLDTVEMNGDGFQAHVRKGSIVHRGDPLVTFDRKKVAAAGHKDTVLMVVTDKGSAEKVDLTTSGTAVAGVTPVIRY